MKRRRAIQAILGTPVLTALVPASGAPQQTSRPASEIPKLATVVADGAADPSPAFFTTEQLAALRKLGDLLVPKSEHRPGAADAKAAEFLDFLIAQSGHARQVLYSNGLDRLQLESGKRFNRRFEDITAEQADGLLAPLRTLPAGHGSSLEEFLWAVRGDLLAATLNSREYAEAQTAAGRRASGTGTYWYPIE